MCADEPELYRVLHQLTAQPLRHRVRVTVITSVTWPDLPAPPAATHDQLPALLAWATGLQVGGHTRGHRLTVHCGPTRFTDIHGYGLGLDAIAARVSPRRPDVRLCRHERSS